MTPNTNKEPLSDQEIDEIFQVIPPPDLDEERLRKAIENLFPDSFGENGNSFVLWMGPGAQQEFDKAMREVAQDYLIKGEAMHTLKNIMEKRLVKQFPGNLPDAVISRQVMTKEEAKNLYPDQSDFIDGL